MVSIHLSNQFLKSLNFHNRNADVTSTSVTAIRNRFYFGVFFLLFFFPFLMWTMFKVLTEFVTILLLLYVLVLASRQVGS